MFSQQSLCVRINYGINYLLTERIRNSYFPFSFVFSTYIDTMHPTIKHAKCNICNAAHFLFGTWRRCIYRNMRHIVQRSCRQLHQHSVKLHPQTQKIEQKGTFLLRSMSNTYLPVRYRTKCRTQGHSCTYGSLPDRAQLWAAETTLLPSQIHGGNENSTKYQIFSELSVRRFICCQLKYSQHPS